MEIIKSFLPSSVPQIGIDNSLIWPISPRGLIALYLNSPEHCRCVQIKANSAFGAGIEFESDADKIVFENACETDATGLFVDLGVDLEVFGNAWLETARSGNIITALKRLPSLTMRQLINGGHIQTVYDGAQDIQVVFSAEEAMIFKVSCPAGNAYSYPSWIGVNGMIELAEAATRYNEKFFTNRAMPEYCITTSGYELTDAQKETARSFFGSEYKGLDNAHRTLYLHLPSTEAKIEFKQITADVKDGDFLSLLNACRERIPMAHGVPLRVLGATASGQLGNGAEVTQQLKVFEDFTLKPMRNRLMSQLRPMFQQMGITSEAQFVQIDTTSEDDFTASISGWLADGLIDRMEAREMIGLQQGGTKKMVSAWLKI